MLLADAGVEPGEPSEYRLFARSRRAARAWHTGARGRTGDTPTWRGQALRPGHRGGRARPGRARGHVRRPARPQRRGQVDDDAAADGAVDRRRGRARAAGLQAAGRVEAGARATAASCRSSTTSTRRSRWSRTCSSSRTSTGSRGATGRRRSSGRSPWPSSSDRRDTRVDKLSGGMRRRLLIARGARAPAAARAARRADRRARPAGAPGAVGADRRAAQRRHDDPHVDALHRGGAAPRRHGADHVPRQGGRQPARRRRWCASTPAREALEVYGPPAHLAEVEAEALGEGLRTRRTGTSVSILGVETSNGFDAEGERRPANLEDVFVLLTGEEIG